MLIRILAAVMLVPLSGCGRAEPADPKIAQNGDRINEADIAFASDMTVHHAQALQLVSLVRDHSSSPELKALGERLLTEQVDQTNTFVTWLADWGEEVPATPLDHANAEDHDHGSGGLVLSGEEMPGLLSSEQVDDLQALNGDEFDRRWADLMLQQQRGAVQMSDALQESGSFGPAKAVARTISTEHKKTLEQLTRLG